MKQRGFIQIPLLIGLVILVVTIPVGVKLVQQRTQIESEASIDAPCKSCSGTTCKTIASPPQCHHSFNECSNNYDCGYTPPTNTPIPPTPTDPPEESFPSYAPLPTHVPTYTPTPIPPTPTPIPPTPTEPPEEPFPSYGPLPTHACLIIGAYCGPGASGSCCSTLQCSNYTCQLKPTSTPRPIRTPTPTLPPPTNTPIPPTPTDPPEESYPTYAPLPTHVPTSIPTPIPTYSPQPRLINRPLGATCGTSDIFIMLCAEGECRDGTCQLPQATQTEYRCGPGNMWVEQKQPDGSWQKTQTCSTYCQDGKCQEQKLPDPVIDPLANPNIQPDEQALLANVIQVVGKMFWDAPIIGPGRFTESVEIATAYQAGTDLERALTGSAHYLGLTDVVDSSNRLFYQTGLSPEEAREYQENLTLQRITDAFIVGSSAVAAGDFVSSTALTGLSTIQSQGTLAQRGFQQTGQLFSQGFQATDGNLLQRTGSGVSNIYEQGISTLRRKPNINILPFEEIPLFTAEDINLGPYIDETFVGSTARVHKGTILIDNQNQEVAIKIKMTPDSVYRGLMTDEEILAHQAEYFQRELRNAQIYDQLGVGPKFYGRVEIDNKHGYVMDIVPGDFPELAPQNITPQTASLLREKTERLLNSSLVHDAADFQYFVTPDGEPIFIDANLLTEQEWLAKGFGSLLLDIENEIRVLNKIQQGYFDSIQ